MDKSQSLSALTQIFADSHRPSYVVRVRGPGVGPGPWSWPGIDFLWGSANITLPQSFDQPLYLHIRNAIYGEDVTVGRLVGPLASGVQTPVGVLVGHHNEILPEDFATARRPSWRAAGRNTHRRRSNLRGEQNG